MNLKMFISGDKYGALSISMNTMHLTGAESLNSSPIVTKIKYDEQQQEHEDYF